MKKALFYMLILLPLFGCKDSGGEPFSPTSPFTTTEALVTTSFANYQAFETYQKDNDLEKACDAIALEEESTNFDISLQLFEDEKTFSCFASDDWRGQCSEIGSYSGSVVKFSTEEGEIAITLTQVDPKTIQTIAVAFEGQALPLSEVFDKPNDAVAKILSTEDIENIIILNRDCKN